VNRLAVFDVDGTLFRPPSVEIRFMTNLLAKGLLTAPILCRSLANGFKHGLKNGTGLRNYPRFWMQGFKLTELQSQASYFLDRNMERLLIPAIKDQINESMHEGRLAVLISGVPEFMLELIGKRLGSHRIAGTRLLTDFSGMVTGAYEHPRPNGQGKMIHLLKIAKDVGADLRLSVGYANEGIDASHLALLGKAVAVNPDQHLMRLADHLGWEKLYAD
jgi:phosphoserine phosphatase